MTLLKTYAESYTNVCPWLSFFKEVILQIMEDVTQWVRRVHSNATETLKTAHTQTHTKKYKDAPQAAISGCHSSWALRQKDGERERRAEKVGVVAQWRLTGRQEADGANETGVFNELLHCRGEERSLYILKADNLTS